MCANITQNSKKNVAAIVAVTLVFGMMIGLGIQTTDAQLTDKKPGERLGSKDVLRWTPQNGWGIEGENMIGEIDDTDPVAPQAKLIRIETYNQRITGQDPVTFKIVYSLTAGQRDLKDIQILVKSDLGEWDYKISSLDAFAKIFNTARVKAMDPETITGAIVGYSAVGHDKIKTPVG